MMHVIHLKTFNETWVVNPSLLGKGPAFVQVILPLPYTNFLPLFSTLKAGVSHIGTHIALESLVHHFLPLSDTMCLYESQRGSDQMSVFELGMRMSCTFQKSWCGYSR